MGKPLSRPDCLRQSPACLGKGEDEDGYIEDCYVPQRSIYDTMRINEQIDQGSKLTQPSKSSLEKGDSSTISSNGTLGAPGALESKVPENKKLDERVIFDALKLSSDVSKSAPAPPRRRPNLEKKENINRRSWKSFMPPNFPEFAERIEASLSEVSETAASDPSLQEKPGSLTAAETCSPSDPRESLSEPLTLEHVPRPSGLPDLQEARPPREALCEFSQEECQAFLEPENMVVDLTGGRWKGHRLVSATWPRLLKNPLKAPGLRGNQDTMEADDSECVIETVPLSPCLSEELLDPGMGVLLSPGLREKTESELRFEEDERLIMMEAEEWEEGSLSEKGKATEETKGCLTGISEERGQLCLPFVTVEEAVEKVAGVQGTYNHPLHQQEPWDDSEPQAASSALVPQETHQDFSALLGEGGGVCGAEAVTIRGEGAGFASGLELCLGPPAPEQFSDTDSVQMFLELEKLCMNEEEKDGEAPTEFEVQNVTFSSEGLDLLENLDLPSEAGAKPSQHLTHHEISVADSAMVSDLEDFDATFGSQVASATEPILSDSFSEQDTSGDSEKGMLPNPAVAKDIESQYCCDHSSSVTLGEEDRAELLMTEEVAKSHKAKGQLDSIWRESVVPVHVPCCRAQAPCIHVAEEETSPLFSGTERTSLSQDEFATIAEDLNSQQEFDLIEGVMSPEEPELFASYELNPSEMMVDFSNWDVPELGSEDDVVKLDKENILFAIHPEETEGMGDFWPHLPSDSEMIQGSKESIRRTGSLDHRKSIDTSNRYQLELLPWPVSATEEVVSTTFLQEEEPKITEQATVDPVVERDFMDPGILELLFGQSGSSEVTEEGERDAKFVDAYSRPSGPVDCSWEAQDSVGDFAGRLEGEATSFSPLPRDEDSDVLPDTVEGLASTIMGLCTINATDFTLLSLSGSLNSILALDLSVEDATSLIGDGDDSETATWVCSSQEMIPALQTAQEISSLPMPLCPIQCPDKEELPIQEEWTMIPSSSEESMQVIQGMDESILPFNVSLEEHLSQWESSLLILAFDTSRDVPSSPAELPASEAEEETHAMSGMEALSSFSTPGSTPGSSELVPDNEQFQKEQVDPLQLKLQQVNGLGQGLVQSAGKNCDVQGLEHDMEEINTRWNTLNKKVAQRVAQLQEALLHCGKFQDALEPLLSWLTDTEELISNQKPPSAEYKVVKAQIQEQKLLQRLLDDRKATVEMIQAEGGRIARSAEPADREKIVGQLNSLGSHWASLLSKASARQSQLEEILVLARQFHETSEPTSEWLSVTEKKLANSEPIGTQTAKIQQQIARHKALEEEIDNQATSVTQVVSIGHSLALLSCRAEQASLAEKLDLLESRYAEVSDRCGRKAVLLEQALSNARLFGEDEVEVLNWLAEVEDRLSLVSVKDYRREVLQQQHSGQLALNDEIVNRKKHVDQAIKNGQALLKQTTGEEVLLIQEKLDGIKTRYSDITAASSKALRTLEQARQLATKFQSTHEELTGWMGQVEEELMYGGGHSPTGEQIPQFQQRQKELKKEVMEHQIILDTVNEVSHALLELVPWRAREGLDKLVSDTNERYKATSDTINQRVAEIDAAIQRSQQYEQAADAELAWVAETRRKLLALGPVRLEQDQTTAQLQVQKAFSIDIIRHKDSVDELLSQRTEIFGTCGEEQKVMLQEKTESLLKQYDATSHLHSERYARLERAQVLVNQFWETYEELSPWVEETQALIGQLPPPAIDHEHLKQQQEDMRQLRESIAEHKPHIDKLLKIGPQLTELNPEEGAMVQGKYFAAEATYSRIKEEVRQRAQALDEAISQSTQFHDKIEPMLEMLETLSSRLRMPPLIPAEVEKIRECIGDNKNATLELDKLQPSFEGLKRRGEELIGRSQGADRDLAAKNIQDKLDHMVFFWEDIKARAEEREIKFLDVLELAEKFWYDMAALLTTIRDTQDIVHDLESPGIDPSIIKQQIEAAETIKEETDGLHEELEFIRILGADLIFACGEMEKPEVKKSIDELNGAWEHLNRTWKERLEKLEEAMQNAVQYQDNLQAMFDWLDNTVIKLCNMSPVGTDLNTVKEQLNEMKEFKTEVYQQQIEMEKLNHQGELLLKKATDETDRDIIREPLTELKHLWENLSEKIAHRQHKLEGSLLALGQFQHALAELMAWLTHTEELLDSQRPINGDPKVIEVELAKHHVLKNDVLAHQATVETVNKAGNELLESSATDDASSLRNRLETMNSCWESVLQKTEVREQQLQATLQQAQGFHGEIEDFLLWLTRMESQLSASKPTGGLPETAREQLNIHMELYAQLKVNEEIYSQLLAKGRLMLLSHDDSGSGSKMEQSVALLEQKWVLVSTKMEERKSKLEEALNLATEFQNSLQDFINWLTLGEQSLNVASPPSLILNTVLSQVEEHKGFANEVNAHRHQIIALDQSGNQLKFLSQKQDVVLIKNLLVSVQSRWEKVVQRSVERGRALDDARKRAKQFHEAWKKLVDWLDDAENHLNSELEISNDPDKIKLQLSKHKVGVQLQCIYIFNFETAHPTQCTINDINNPHKYCNPLGGRIIEIKGEKP
ncbi:PREDICTED: microtubule-actin cross-linking factor 1-like isoform X2 [Thamnophis sirtalis]|uniref:Microtubule-actin cross-linking factor 1-like isoform X2 n=1 Tax=Thamnophis sirtalis TaxID=35019 RepID=A0A6I9X211_9SAUR|nr:PREDICTED: microtubule-actin cross-linking factor 1-like isoform X2 [Thamnophis sirtalis]